MLSQLPAHCKSTPSRLVAWNRATWNRIQLERGCGSGAPLFEALADAETAERVAAVAYVKNAAVEKPVSSDEPPFDAKDAEKCEACGGSGEIECTEHLGVSGSEYDATRECDVCDGLGYVQRRSEP
jgi:DnaJ-class molecular chaperone